MNNDKIEKNEISIQEAKFYATIKNISKDRWVTAREVKDMAEIGGSSSRIYALKLTKLGILDLAEVWPAHRYRVSDKASKRNKAYLQRLENALEVFSINQICLGVG